MESMLKELAPALVAVVALIIPIFASERIRTIVGSIFRRPTKRTVVLTIGDQTLELNNVSAEEQRKLIDLWISQHSDITEDKTAAPPDEKGGRDE
jgi:hypothetical protein